MPTTISHSFRHEEQNSRQWSRNNTTQSLNPASPLPVHGTHGRMIRKWPRRIMPEIIRLLECRYNLNSSDCGFLGESIRAINRDWPQASKQQFVKPSACLCIRQIYSIILSHYIKERSQPRATTRLHWSLYFCGRALSNKPKVDLKMRLLISLLTSYN